MATNLLNKKMTTNAIAMHQNGIGFVDSEHFIHTCKHTDERYSSVMTPYTEKGFVDGVVLYPHQATIIAALLDVENKRVIKISNNEDYKKYTVEPMRIETSAVVLSEPFGSGKTFEILGLILLQPVPKAFAEHSNFVLIPEYPRYITTRSKLTGFKHELIRKFTKPNALIRPNLIIVGTSVLTQWEKVIKTNTKLNVFVIGNYYSLKNFKSIFNKGAIKAYDIVLLKNGTVINSDRSATSTKEHESLVNAVAAITSGYCWSRVIYDDFDTIRIPPGSGGINALFTIYVSATSKSGVHSKNKQINYPSIAKALECRFNPLTEMLRDVTLHTNFNLRNKKNFVEESTNIPIINKYRYVYANPDDNYIRLIGAMGEVDAHGIMEMLNGDAIGTAADALGIKTNSVADIFEKMLDKKYQAYLNDGYIIDTIVATERNVYGLDPNPEGKQHSAIKLEEIRKEICKKIVPKIGYSSGTLLDMLIQMKTEFIKSKEQNGIAINRVKDNIKLGDCQVCCVPLAEMDAFIVRCCGLVVCDICGIKGNQVGKKYDYETKLTTIKGSCANCKAIINPLIDLIFVDKNFDMEALLDAKGDEKPIVVKEVEEPKDLDPIEPTEPEIKNPKLKALLAIIRGKIPEARENAIVNIKHLLEGVRDKPQPFELKRKVLVFANFDETLELVRDFLTEQKIEYLSLHGTFSQMADIVDKFKTTGSILLINSQQNCAGLNIQFCTDIVFMHKILDTNIESQVCGRGQRIGREYNLRIHYLLYNNEKAMM